MRRNDSNLHISIFGNEGSIHVRRWVLGLRARGHSADLITFHKDSRHDIGAISLNANHKISYLLKVGTLRKVVRDLRPDIFHSHYASSYGFLSSFLDHPRKVLSVWGDDIVVFPYKSAINKWMARKALINQNQITVTSDYLKMAVAQIGPILPKISIIPFGVDTKLFKFVERNCRPDLKIGIAKHLHSYYGIDCLIAAFYMAEKKHRKIRLFIAGKGPEENRYRHQARKLGLGDKIVFLGELEHGMIADFYENMDIAVMPSRTEAESFGVAAIEAAATGLPVVATRIGGIPEVVQDGVTGCLADVDNSSEIARLLERLIEDADLRNQMGRAGRQMVTERYDWEANMTSMERLYFDMMQA